jgi:signal transduction histidine kinase
MTTEAGGFGLTAMRERVEQFGGTLLVESAPGEGTTVVVEIPVRARSETGHSKAGPSATGLIEPGPGGEVQ